MALTLAELEAAIGVAGDNVKALKTAKADKAALEPALATLVQLKTELTKLDPTHALAIQDKKAKKASEKAGKAPAAAAPVVEKEGPSKNDLKKAAKAAAKSEKRDEHPAAPAAAPAAAAKAAPAKAAPVKAKAAPGKPTDGIQVHYSPAHPPVLVRLVAGVLKTAVSMVEDTSALPHQPVVTLPSGTKVFGDATVARFVSRASKNAFLGEGESLALVEQWVDFSLSYPAVGDFDGLAKAVDARMEHATYLVGDALSFADAAVWAALLNEKQLPSNAARWCKLVSSVFQPLAEAKFTATVAAKEKPAATASNEGGCPALEGAVEGQVVTRFPPEPSGYLHIGHAKAVLLNDYYARRYKGKLLVRFDDTNPSKEKEEYADNILKDLEMLGIPVQDAGKEGCYVSLSHTSDHFDVIATLARKLITDGFGFMDDTPQEEMKLARESRTNSKYRDESVALNLERFETMYAGKGALWCLRAKIDMSSDNGTLRDPVMFRCNVTPHHRTGTKYNAYPTYDLACPIVDSIEGVTHALRTTEYNDRDAQYAWLQEKMVLRQVRIHAFSRINFVKTVMSKRKLLWFVEQNLVEGWNDPRFPTIQGVLRRGVSVQALRDFIISQGASRNIINLEWDSFWAINKAAYEPVAPRLMAVEACKAAKLTLTNVPHLVDGIHAKSILVHPKEALGDRALRLSNNVLLEAEDAQGIAAGDEVVLMRWGLVKITVAKTVDGSKVFEGEFCPNGTVKKKKSLSWLADVADVADCVLVEYDYLITKAKLEENDSLTDPGVLTQVSVVETAAFGDAALKLLKVDDVIQLERRGFYRCDQAAAPGKAVRLIYIPDGKQKVPFTRLPSATK